VIQSLIFPIHTSAKKVPPCSISSFDRLPPSSPVGVTDFTFYFCGSFSGRGEFTHLPGYPNEFFLPLPIGMHPTSVADSASCSFFSAWALTVPETPFYTGNSCLSLSLPSTMRDGRSLHARGCLRWCLFGRFQVLRSRTLFCSHSTQLFRPPSHHCGHPRGGRESCKL